MEQEDIFVDHSMLNIASYGFGKFLNEFMDMAFTSLTYFFYVRTVGVDPLIVGLATIIFAIWNAVNDPLVGYLTNRPFKFTKKWGRRFPWIVIGGIPWILSYILVFTPPNVDPQSDAWIIFIWFIFSTCLYDTFNSIFFVNFASLFPDKFRSVKERRKATGIQTPIGIFGVALGAILPPLIIDYADSTSFIIQAGVMIIVGFIIFFISIPGYREDQITIDRYLDKHKVVDERVPFFKSLKIALKQQPFLIFIITYTLYRTLVISIQASVPFVVEFILAEEEEFQTFLSGGFLIGALISSPIWAMLANKTNNNRKIMLITSSLLTAFTVPLFFLNSAIPMVIAVIIWGFGLGGFWTMIAPVLADVIDESIVKTHRREEGIYNGFQQFFGRLAVLLQALSFSVIQTLTNFKEGQPLEAQPHSAIIGIQVHFALIPAYVMLIGTLIFWNWYKLTPDKVTENQLKVIELGL